MKSKPTLEKIQFSKEEQEDIKNILEGRPSKKHYDKLVSRGWDVEAYIKRRAIISKTHRIDTVRKKYFHGLCR